MQGTRGSGLESTKDLPGTPWLPLSLLTPYTSVIQNF